jgi:hypothetical protein
MSETHRNDAANISGESTSGVNLSPTQATAAQPAEVEFVRRARWLDVVPKDIRIQAGRRLVSETPAIVAGSDEADVAIRELAVALLAGCGLDGDECIDALADFMLSSEQFWDEDDIVDVVCDAMALAPLGDPCELAAHLEPFALDVVQANGVRVDVAGREVVVRKGDTSLSFLPACGDASRAVQYDQALLRLLPDVPSNLLKGAAKVMAINPEVERQTRTHPLTRALRAPFRAFSRLLG